LVFTPFTANGSASSLFTSGRSWGQLALQALQYSGPEIEHHHLAAVVARLESLALLVLSLDLLGRIADEEMADRVQLRAGLLNDCIAVRDLHVTEVPGGPIEEGFGLAQGLGTVPSRWDLEIVPAEQGLVLPDRLRPLPGQAEPLLAAVRELGQPQAGHRPKLPAQARSQERREQRVGLPVEAIPDPPARLAEPVAPDEVTLQDGEGPELRVSPRRGRGA
jgi:hypothetical protein